MGKKNKSLSLWYNITIIIVCIVKVFNPRCTHLSETINLVGLKNKIGATKKVNTLIICPLIETNFGSSQNVIAPRPKQLNITS